jgi:hypothetical protein
MTIVVVIASASEAIHRRREKESWIASSQALLAMTETCNDAKRTSAFSRHDAPELLHETHRPETRGRGECRVPNAPAASCALG